MQHFWVFSLQTPLSEAQASTFDAQVAKFLAQWKAHGTPVPARYELRHRQFLLVQALDMPSGCSVDSLRKDLDAAAIVVDGSFADAATVFVNTSDGVKGIHFQEIPTWLASGKIGPDTLVYDHTVANSGTFDGFEKPLSQSWLSRYLVAA